MSNKQGYPEAPNSFTGKAIKHQKNALKNKGNDISNAEIVPTLNIQRLHLKYKAWTDEDIFNELNLIIKEIDKFPTTNELENMNRSDLVGAIINHGGILKFQNLLGYESKYKIRSDKNILSELEYVIKETGNFPTQNELKNMGKGDLVGAIAKYGGILKFRNLLGYEPKRKTWTDEIIINELKEVIKEINNFPTESNLKEMNKIDLVGAITMRGGYPKFQKILGYEPKRIKWTEETIITELEPIIEELDHFPTHNELNKMGKSVLSSAISEHGGMNYFKELLGCPLSLQEEYISELSSYINKRGAKSEQFVKEIITEWSELHGKPLPDFNVKLSKGNILEFVCDFDKKVGIDVTNTKASKKTAFRVIDNKWKHKEYHLHLDELWIVVFTDVLSLENYDTLNTKSPENVKIFSIDGFLRELDYSIKYCDVDKIDKLKNCCFHNKEEMMKLTNMLVSIEMKE